MSMNWIRLILLMFPIRLRKSRFFFAILWSLTKYTRRRYEEQSEYITKLKAEMRYTSQYASLEKLLQKHFGDGIEITEDKDVENITYVKPDNYNDNTYVPMIIRNEKDVIIERDFVILVPSGVDKEQVRAMVERYTFCGIYFAVKDK